MSTNPDGTRNPNYSSLELYEEMEGGNRAAEECHIDLEGAMEQRAARERFFGRFRIAGYIGFGILLIMPLVLHRSTVNSDTPSDPFLQQQSDKSINHPKAHIVLHKRNHHDSFHHSSGTIHHDPTESGYHYDDGGNSSNVDTNFTQSEDTFTEPLKPLSTFLSQRWKQKWKGMDFNMSGILSRSTVTKNQPYINAILSGDGRTLMVANRISSTFLNLTEAGMVAVFKWNKNESAWLESAQVMGTIPFAQFGAEISSSYDGSMLAVSSAGIGKAIFNARLYKFNATNVTETILPGPPGTPAGGPSVLSLSDNGQRVVLGTPHLKLLKSLSGSALVSYSSGSNFTIHETITLQSDRFWSTSVSANGTRVASTSGADGKYRLEIWEIAESKDWKTLHSLALFRNQGERCVRAFAKLSNNGETMVFAALLEVPGATYILRIIRLQQDVGSSEWTTSWTRDIVETNAGSPESFPLDVSGDGGSLVAFFDNRLITIEWKSDGTVGIQEHPISMRIDKVSLSYNGLRLVLSSSVPHENTSPVGIFERLP